MSRLLPTVAALLTIFGAGFGASMIFFRHAKQITLSQLLFLSWLLGTGIVSVALFGLGLLVKGVALQIIVTVISLGLTAAGFALTRRVSIELPRSNHWIDYGLAGVLGLEIGLIFVLTFKHALGWDGLLIWELKARYAFLNGGALPAAYFSDATRGFSHPEYPLYLPMIEMWIYMWIGEPDQFWVKLIFPIYFAVGTIFLAYAGGELSGSRRIGLLVANLFLFVPFLTRVAGGIVFGYADVPLSLFYAAAFYFLWTFARSNSRETLWTFIALSALLPSVKKEGAILWIALTCCSAPIIFRKRGGVVCLISLLTGVISIAIWQIYLRMMHAGPGQDFVPVTASLALSNLNRLGPIFQTLLAEATTLARWNLLWYMLIFAFLSFLCVNRTRRAGMLVICSILPLILYCLTYLFSAWPNYLRHVESSLPRLLLHVTPLAILSIALALAPLTRTPAATET